MRYTITAVPENTMSCDQCRLELRWFARHRVECTDPKTEAFTSWVKLFCDQCLAEEIASWDQRGPFAEALPKPAPRMEWQAWAMNNGALAGDWHGR